MLKEVIEDAIARGERLKKDIVGQILKSATINELLNNRRFTETIAKVIQTKDEIARTIHRNVQDALKTMSIPSKNQLSSYERRINMLEKKIDSMGRNLMKKKLNGGHKRRRAGR
ncbi:MAG TPA: phasin family protein [bacterium]|nr:phasin family protein [bacterium]